MFTRTFRWQQLAIAVLVGILIGAVGQSYFVTPGPETDTAEYILFLKQGMDRKAAQAASSAETSVKPQRVGSRVKPRQHTHTPAESPSDAEPGTVPGPETAEPSQ